MLRHAVTLGVSILLFACGGATSTGSSAAPAEDGGVLETAPDESVTSTFGIWHRAQVDATNLEIKADGTFRWTIEGCDFGGGDCGVWKAHPEGGIVLRPAAGDTSFEWMGSGFRDAASALRVTRVGDTVVIRGTVGGEVRDQKWELGRVCAQCGGTLGPTGQNACDVPLPDVCQ